MPMNRSMPAMKVKSCFSVNLDPYRAGVEIGDELAAMHPEVVFLFSSIHYDGSSLLLEGIYDALPSQETVLIGSSGDGFYEKNKVAGVGASALGINGGGAVRWLLDTQSGLETEPFDATRQCLERLNAACRPGDPRLYFLAADFRADTSQIVAALQESAAAPVVGGLAGDDHSIQRCFVYANRLVLTDAIAILAIDGDLPYDIRIAHDLEPIGKPGIITDQEGATVRTIDNIPAMDFLEQELGKPLNVVDEGTLTFKLMSSAPDGEQRIRSLLLPEDPRQDRSVRLFGGVYPGDRVQVCLAPPKRITRDVETIADSLASLPFQPVAALMVSCAGRKKVLGGIIDNEVRDIVQKCPSIEAVAGFPSFGEFGPVKSAGGFSKALFHNMTYILLVIGMPEP